MELTKQPFRGVIKNSQREVEADTRADGSLCKENPMPATGTTDSLRPQQLHPTRMYGPLTL